VPAPANNHPIRVCFIAPKAYPLFNPDVKKVFGGAEVDLYFLAIELAKDKNFTVSFLVADYGQPETVTIEGVRIIKTLDFTKNSLNGAIKVWKGLREADARIYFQEAASWGTFLAALFCKLHKKAFVYRTASQQECDGTYLKQHYFAGRAFRWALRNAAKTIVQNEMDKQNIEQTLGVCSIIYPNAQRLPVLSEVQKDIILWVGRSAQVKRPELFIELAEKIPNERFVMICQRATGDQNYDLLLSRAREVKNLQFIERVPFAEIGCYFQRAKVFVNTSDSEGFPNTFIQACNYAVPILSLKVNPDGFLDKYNCGQSCNSQFQKLVDSLKFMLAENNFLKPGKNARRYAEQNHDINKIVEEYKRLFAGLLDEKEL
jgi:glycosyltransferase involved in cell wall biosynthesis